MATSEPKPGARFDVYGLVPDGLATVTVGRVKANVKNNAFLIQDAPASAESIVVDGPGRHAAIEIGQQVPPGVTIAPDPE